MRVRTSYLTPATGERCRCVMLHHLLFQVVLDAKCDAHTLCAVHTCARMTLQPARRPTLRCRYLFLFVLVSK